MQGDLQTQKRAFQLSRNSSGTSPKKGLAALDETLTTPIHNSDVAASPSNTAVLYMSTLVATENVAVGPPPQRVWASVPSHLEPKFILRRLASPALLLPPNQGALQNKTQQILNKISLPNNNSSNKRKMKMMTILMTKKRKRQKNFNEGSKKPRLSTSPCHHHLN